MVGGVGGRMGVGWGVVGLSGGVCGVLGCVGRMAYIRQKLHNAEHVEGK